MNIDENIVWFKVSVRYVLAMTICYCLQNLFYYVGSLYFTKYASLRNFFEKLTTFEQFLNKVNKTFVLVNFEQLDNVWMSKFFKYLYLNVQIM